MLDTFKATISKFEPPTTLSPLLRYHSCEFIYVCILNMNDNVEWMVNGEWRIVDGEWRMVMSYDFNHNATITSRNAK